MPQAPGVSQEKHASRLMRCLASHHVNIATRALIGHAFQSTSNSFRNNLPWRETVWLAVKTWAVVRIHIHSYQYKVCRGALHSACLSRITLLNIAILFSLLQPPCSTTFRRASKISASPRTFLNYPESPSALTPTSILSASSPKLH